MTIHHELLRRETRRGKVLKLLMQAKQYGHVKLGDRTMPTPDGWVPGFVLDRQDVGGQNGTRRLRELRAAGHDIEAQQMPGRDAWRYRWAGVAEVDPPGSNEQGQLGL